MINSHPTDQAADHNRQSAPVRRILLADNNATYRASLNQLLTSCFYEVVEARSVHEAIEQLSNVQCDLVLVDLRLVDDADPYDVSGLDVAKSAVARRVPCVVLTAFPTIDVARLVLRARGIEPPFAIDLIPKSDGPTVLLSGIETALKRAPNTLYLLHLSDLHLSGLEQARRYRTQLESDLVLELGIHHLDYLVISGDVLITRSQTNMTPQPISLTNLLKRWDLRRPGSLLCQAITMLTGRSPLRPIVLWIEMICPRRFRIVSKCRLEIRGHWFVTRSYTNNGLITSMIGFTNRYAKWSIRSTMLIKPSCNSILKTVSCFSISTRPGNWISISQHGPA